MKLEKTSEDYSNIGRLINSMVWNVILFSFRILADIYF